MTNHESANYESAVGGGKALVFLAAIVIGTITAAVVLPSFVPGLSASMIGNQPKVFWYLSRATAFVALGLLWASMMLGVGITNKMARLWPGAQAAFALHEYTSLLGLGFAVFHGLILLGDAFSNYSLAQLLVPFASSQYHPFWVGFGQLSLYTFAIVTGSFYVRKQIGQKTWRALHYVSFFTYVGALIHGLTAGSDTGLGWAQGFYWLTGASFLFLLMYRIINSLFEKAEKQAKLQHPAQR